MTDTKIEPSKTPTLEGCPNCDSKCHTFLNQEAAERIPIECGECNYRAADLTTHNKLCELVRRGKLVEKFLENPPFKAEPHEYDGWTRIAGNKGWNCAVQACVDMLTKKGGE